MNLAEMQQRANRDIDRRLDGLCSSAHARRQMDSLARTFQRLAGGCPLHKTDGRQVAEILHTAAFFLKRSLERRDQDGKVLLEAVNSLCWDRHHEAAEEVPGELLEAFAAAGPALPARLAVWERAAGSGYGQAMTATLAWRLVAELVSDAAHLDEGEAELLLSPLLAALEPGAGPVDLN